MGNVIDPANPLPTGVGSCAGHTAGPCPADWDDNRSVGRFEGGGTVSTGVCRPVMDCRMRSNLPSYCPVCYTTLKRLNDADTGRTFQSCHAGDFNADGKDEVVVFNG